MKSLILRYHEQIVNGSKTVLQIINKAHEQLEKNKNLNATLFDNFDQAKQLASQLDNQTKTNVNLLFGIPYSLKDNITTKNIISTGGSLFLKNYLPSFNASCYQHLINNQAILLAKANLDEFGLGATGLDSAFKEVHNFFDYDRITGGSSSGSCVHVASSSAVFSIGTDTGDSIRRPATFNNVVGYKPSYGLISRYGVMPYAPSLDHVGIITNSVCDAAIVAQSLVQFDPKDYTSQKILNSKFFDNLKPITTAKIGIIKNIEHFLQEDVLERYYQVLDLLKKAKYQFVEFDFDEQILKSLKTIYLIISNAEACSCYANMTGIPFGEDFGGKDYHEILLKNRTANFGKQIKRRFTIGAYITKSENFDPIFQRSKKIRTLINNYSNKILTECDVLLIPGASSTAPKISDVKNHQYQTNSLDDLLLLANFGGYPSISIPTEFVNNLPYGINLTCNQNQDQKLLNIAINIEMIIDQNLGGNHE